MNWSVYCKPTDDKAQMIVRLSRVELGRYPISTWKTDAAREMVELVGAAADDAIEFQMLGKKTPTAMSIKGLLDGERFSPNEIEHLARDVGVISPSQRVSKK